MATPLVSGVIALYLQQQPLLTLSHDQIMQKLTEDCLKNVLKYRYLDYCLQRLFMTTFIFGFMKFAFFASDVNLQSIFLYYCYDIVNC